MKNEIFKIDCEVAVADAIKAARKEVRQFCDIMGWTDADVFYVAEDPHGVVSLGDYFFNMSDIHEVVANYPKLIERYGSNEELSNAIIRWYDWTLEYHSKHPVMDWQRVERFNALTNETEYNLPPIPEGKDCSKRILFKTKEYGICDGIYDGITKKFLSWSSNFFYSEFETSHWVEISEPTDEHNINLHSWLNGAWELVEKGE